LPNAITLQLFIIYLRRSHDRSVIGGDNNFILRRVDTDEGPGFDLGECSQRDESKKDRPNAYIHLSIKSDETGVTSYSYPEHTLAIRNAAPFVR